MEQPKKEQNDDAEREQAGISQEDWEAAFEWADDPAVPADADGPLAVWACNWDAVMVFLACSTQWKRHPSGGFRGLDYPGVDVVLSRRKLADADAVFGQVQLMEQAALGVLNG